MKVHMARLATVVGVWLYNHETDCANPVRFEGL